MPSKKSLGGRRGTMPSIEPGDIPGTPGYRAVSNAEDVAPEDLVAVHWKDGTMLQCAS